MERQAGHPDGGAARILRQREQDRQVLSEEQRAAVLALAHDFPALWRDPKTPDRERKRMMRLLLEHITLSRGEHTPYTSGSKVAPPRR